VKGKKKQSKAAQYERDLNRYFSKIRADLRDRATFAGFPAWDAGYRAGYKAAKAASETVTAAVKEDSK
jgi:hypothetical protein